MNRKKPHSARKALLLCVFSWIGIGGHAVAAELTFNIKGLDGQKGQVLLALYSSDNAKNFPTKNKSAICNLIVPIADLTRTPAQCPNLKLGRYAAVAVHDKNSNNVPDHNFIGLPMEPIAFSNGCKIRLGPPRFKACAFDLTDDKQELTIQFNNS